MEEVSDNFLKDILQEISKVCDSHFAGVGIVLYKKIEELPVTQLRQSDPEWLRLPYDGIPSLPSIIIKLNSKESIYHDGFHLISKDGLLTHLCQYFSPAITPAINIDYTKGGRFRAAQYGSCLKNVIATGVIGHTYGPYIFIKGTSYKL